MQHRFWIIKDVRIKRDRYGRAYRPYKRCCQRGELFLVGSELTFGDQRTHVPPQVASLLLALMLRRPGLIFSRDELMEELYEHPDLEAEGNPVGVYLTKVRYALREVGASVTVENRHGRGWALTS